MKKEKDRKTYPLDWVRTAARQIYSRELSDRTFRSWLRICNVKPYSREVTKKACVYILTLAYLKKDAPKASIGLVAIKQFIKQNRHQPDEWLVSELSEAFSSELKGNRLGVWLYHITGKKVSTRTLYRWAKQHSLTFGISQKIPKPEIDKWIAIANSR